MQAHTSSSSVTFVSTGYFFIRFGARIDSSPSASMCSYDQFGPLLDPVDEHAGSAAALSASISNSRVRFL
jgi:hypothetical protein